MNFNFKITCLLAISVFYCLLFCQTVTSEMIFEIKLLEFQNPTNKTYTNKPCSVKLADQSICNTGFLLCLIDLPFRNPQNCTLGDYITPILGSNSIKFSESNKNYTYQFSIKQLPAQGIGMMIEVRDYNKDGTWEPIDFYTSALADVPLTLKTSNVAYTVKKRFSSLFKHNSSLSVQSKLYCAKNFFGSNCETFCDENANDYYTCDQETGSRKCKNGFVGEYCHIPDICATFLCLNNGQCISPDGINYMCQCPDSYLGPNCEIELAFANPCYSQPCFNNGTCTVKNRYFECECQLGFFGVYCEADLRRCTKSPCGPNCVCIEKPQNMSYECKCENNSTTTSYTTSTSTSTSNKIRQSTTSLGSRLLSSTAKVFQQTKPLKINKNYENDYKKINKEESKIDKEIVLESIDGLVKSAEIQTKIVSNNTNIKQMLTCEFSNPCRHGTCYINETKIACKCDQGYMGPYCDLMRHPCDFKPCENGGNCEIVGDLYYKCLCRPNFTGVNCQFEVKPCDTYLCANGGSCAVGDDGEPRCVCSSNYTGVYCEHLKNPCGPGHNPCMNSGVCSSKIQNQNQIVECSCKDDFFGMYCEYKRALCNDSICMNGGICIQINDTMMDCQCDLGFFGEFCELDFDECSVPKICSFNGDCINKVGSFECDCFEGYYGHRCENLIDVCASSPCLNNATCIPDTNTQSVVCVCPTGYNGRYCEISIDMCEIRDICMNNGSCISDSRFPGIYMCECAPSFVGENCEQKIHLCDQINPCLNGGQCSKSMETFADNEFTCICRKGYYGLRCETELDSCDPNPCYNSGTCHQFAAGSFSCECPLGFYGFNCEQDLNVCDYGVCRNNATCIDGYGANYTCYCQPGFGGPSCNLESDICSINPCLNNGECIEMDGNFRCNCVDRFTGRVCDIEIFDPCTNYCENNGACYFINGTIPSCQCVGGFTGFRCEFPINNNFEIVMTKQNEQYFDDETTLLLATDSMSTDYVPPIITNIPQTTTTITTSTTTTTHTKSTTTTITTTTNTTVVKVKTKITAIPTKPTTISTKTITATKNGYMPTSNTVSAYHNFISESQLGNNNDNFEIPSETINPCNTQPCKNGGSCFVTQNNIPQCVCKWGFTGETCEIIRHCREPQLTPCFNNGTCVLGSDNYEYCMCTPHFTGHNCEIMLKNAANQTIVFETLSTPTPDAFLSASPSMYAVQDNGVWLIVIVFGYIFGLFLIFVIIWFVWYGTSLRKRQTPGVLSSSSSNHNFSQYDYSVQSSLNKNHGGTYFPGTIRTNPAFNNHDESVLGVHNQKAAIQLATLSNSATSADEISSSSHTTSFVQNNTENGNNYQHRISI